MTSKSGKSYLPFTLLLLWLGAIAPSYAGCVDQVTGDIGNNFSSAVMCTNTLPNPSYQIGYYEDKDVTFSMFSFDKLNAGYMCISHGEVEGDNLQCRKTGLRSTPSTFRNNGSTVTMLDLASTNGKKKLNGILTENLDFSTATTTERVLSEQCFVGVHNTEIYIGYNSKAIYPLSNCLFAFEKFIGENPKVGLTLR